MKKLFTSDQIRRWDAAIISKGVSSLDLMEGAAHALVPRILQLVSKRCSIVVMAGPGNNGGDALALSRLLLERGFSSLQTFLIAPDGQDLSQDCRSNLERLQTALRLQHTEELPSADFLSDGVFVIDGLFGTGLNRPVEGLYADCIAMINSSACQVLSIDIPSGARADHLSSEENIVQADHVFSFQIPKRSFLLPGSDRFMKSFEIVDIHLDHEFHENEECDTFYLEDDDVLQAPRPRFSHKGDFGHGLLIAGSRGMYGAAQLAARGALRSGIGLLTIHSTSEAMPILQSAVPEAMFSSGNRKEEIADLPALDAFCVIACGPGLRTGKLATAMLDELLESTSVKLVLDADALNIIAANSWQSRIPAGSILSPHPKEFERLFGKSESAEAAISLQRDKAIELNSVIIRKGAHSSIAFPDGKLFFNSTGNPYMATAGMGDVLTGMLLGFYAQGSSAEQAALCAVYRHGEAGDLALAKRRGGWIRASDILDEVKGAF